MERRMSLLRQKGEKHLKHDKEAHPEVHRRGEKDDRDFQEKAHDSEHSEPFTVPEPSVEIEATTTAEPPVSLSSVDSSLVSSQPLPAADKVTANKATQTVKVASESSSTKLHLLTRGGGSGRKR